jgi:hypothetical protein
MASGLDGGKDKGQIEGSRAEGKMKVFLILRNER